MTKLYFIIQNKGGIGKSAYTYNIANLAFMKSMNALFIDMDNETTTSSNQIKFVDYKAFDLIDKNSKQIDRTRLDSFFEGISEQEEYGCIICDLGATSSEQFLKYIEDEEGKLILETLKEMEIDLHIHCVVGGDNTYPACANFCESLFKHTNNLTTNTIVLNRLFSYSDKQIADINKLSKKYNTELTEFNIINETGSKSLNDIKKLMEQGKPAITEAPFLTKKRYSMSLGRMFFEF